LIGGILYDRATGEYNAKPNGRKYASVTHALPGLETGAESTEDGYVPSARDLFAAFQRRVWVIVLMTVVVAGVSLVISLMQTPTYAASIKILVGQESGFVSEGPGNAAPLQDLTRTMTEGIKSRPIAEEVIQRLGLPMTPEALIGALEVEQLPETQFMQVTYRDSSPERAEQVANALGDVFAEQVSDVSQSARALTATVWEPAVTPAAPVSPNTMRNVLVGLALGLVLGTGLAFLLEYLDDSWRTPEEAEQVSGVPNFAVIPEFMMSAGKKSGGS